MESREAFLERGYAIGFKKYTGYFRRLVSAETFHTQVVRPAVHWFGAYALLTDLRRQLSDPTVLPELVDRLEVVLGQMSGARSI